MNNIGQQYDYSWFRRVYPESFTERKERCKALARALALMGVRRALDIGCATGYLVKAFLEVGIDAWGVDVSKDLIEHSPIKERIILCNVEKEALPFPLRYFDVVTAMGVLEHLHNLRYAITEIRRVLTPNGYLLIEVPEPSLDLSPTHVLKISKESWINIICKNGFKKISSGWLLTLMILSTAIETLTTKSIKIPHYLPVRLKGTYSIHAHRLLFKKMDEEVR
jgi:SAM-dependent methyltransferase